MMLLTSDSHVERKLATRGPTAGLHNRDHVIDKIMSREQGSGNFYVFAYRYCGKARSFNAVISGA
jgi:hypothetical protein